MCIYDGIYLETSYWGHTKATETSNLTTILPVTHIIILTRDYINIIAQWRDKIEIVWSLHACTAAVLTGL